MFRLLLRLILFFIGALALLFYAPAFIPGVAVVGDWDLLTKLAIVVTIVNLLLLPVLRFFLKPFMLLTLGLLSIPLNMAALYIAVRFAPAVEILGLLPLFWLSLLLAALNTATAVITRH